MSPSPSDRRREPRHPGAGPVRLFPGEPAMPVVAGYLLDYNRGGFRATHDCPALSAGQVVHFEHLYAGGQARVVWTKVGPDHIESGFLVLSDPRAA